MGILRLITLGLILGLCEPVKSADVEREMTVFETSPETSHHNIVPDPVAIQPDPPSSEGSLEDRWPYERVEYHWWNLSACFCRVSGAAFESIGLLAFFVANGALPIIAVSSLSDDQKIIASVAIAGVNYVAVAAPKMVRYAFQIAAQRERFAQDIAETGGVRNGSLNTPDFEPHPSV